MNVSNNDQIKLSPHFTLGEMTKTSYHPIDGNIPNRVAIENLTNLCENWLEELRESYNKLYVMRNEKLEMRNDDYLATENSSKEEPIIINSGFRSEVRTQKCLSLLCPFAKQTF